MARKRPNNKRGRQTVPTRAPYGKVSKPTQRRYKSGLKTGAGKGKPTLKDVVGGWKRSLSPATQRAAYQADQAHKRKRRRPRR